MEIKKGKDKLILTKADAKVLIYARELLYDIYQGSSDGDDLNTYSYSAYERLNNFLSCANIDIKGKQKSSTEVVIVSIDKFEF